MTTPNPKENFYDIPLRCEKVGRKFRLGCVTPNPAGLRAFMEADSIVEALDYMACCFKDQSPLPIPGYAGYNLQYCGLEVQVPVKDLSPKPCSKELHCLVFSRSGSVYVYYGSYQGIGDNLTAAFYDLTGSLPDYVNEGLFHFHYNEDNEGDCVVREDCAKSTVYMSRELDTLTWTRTK